MDLLKSLLATATTYAVGDTGARGVALIDSIAELAFATAIFPCFAARHASVPLMHRERGHGKDRCSTYGAYEFLVSLHTFYLPVVMYLFLCFLIARKINNPIPMLVIAAIAAQIPRRLDCRWS